MIGNPVSLFVLQISTLPSPPALSNSASLLSTPADFPFFSALPRLVE